MLYPLDSVALQKPQILSVLIEVHVCYKTQTQFSALRFLINKEKKKLFKYWWGQQNYGLHLLTIIHQQHEDTKVIVFFFTTS